MIKKLLFVFVCFTLISNASAQTISTFEDLSLPVDTFWNGSDSSGGFISGNAFFANEYNGTYDSWAGFSYSSKTDSTTANYSNMYSAANGTGFNASQTYATAYISPYSSANYINLINTAKGKIVDGFYINNNAYAYLSMLNGDAYSKKFGGLSGNDPDWFRLKITGYLNGIFTDSTEFYLADFRDSVNTHDYIIKNWTWLDLTSLGKIDSMVFSMSSSDVGSWGMNTPSYFCIDNLSTTDGVGFEKISNNFTMNIYPNPANEYFIIKSDLKIQKAELLSIEGKIIKNIDISSNPNNIIVPLNSINSGIYFVRILADENYFTNKLIIR
ncbi:MAG: hypothetical protein AUJ98_03180 [Bacteroidetes bacterium CG2_30_33_31]|nr:MAG: hypothetical protein AUJ98_03180 [Bacteroidetes bacterium CG2_30_33_31]